MRKLLILLAFLPSVLLAQGPSWINVQLLTDNYPGETSWEILNFNGDTIAQGDSYIDSNTLYDNIIKINEKSLKIQ